MKIDPDPKAWKPWLHAIRQRVKASPELRRARRRAPGLARTVNAGGGIIRAVVPVSIAGSVLGEFDPATTSGLLLVWTLLVTFTRANQVVLLSRAPEHLWLPYFWPLSDDEAFAHQRRIIFRSSAWLGIDWLAFGLATAWHTGDVALAIAAPFLAFGQWAGALAAALFLGRALPRIRYDWAANILGVVAFLSMRFGGSPNWLSPYLAHLWQALHHATPGGWLLNAWTLLREGNALGWVALALLPASGLACVLIGARALRGAFNPEAIFDVPADAENNADPQTSSPPFADTTPSPRLSNSEIARVRAVAAEVLSQPAGHELVRRGPLERSCLWFLTPRDRVVVDYMTPGGQPWLHRWLIAAGLVLIAAIVRHMPFASAFALTAIIPATIGLLFAFPLTGGRWHGFDAFWTFQNRTGVHAFYPLGFGEIVRPLLKLNALYCVFAFPLALAAFVFAFAPADKPFAWSFDHALRLTLAMIAFQPLCLIVKLAGNTRDNFSNVLLLFPIMLGMLSLLVSGVTLLVTFFMVERASVALLCVAAFFLLTHGALLLYGWIWGRGRLDLVARSG